jgi:hypothetical protein
MIEEGGREGGGGCGTRGRRASEEAHVPTTVKKKVQAWLQLAR